MAHRDVPDRTSWSVAVNDIFRSPHHRPGDYRSFDQPYSRVMVTSAEEIKWLPGRTRTRYRENMSPFPHPFRRGINIRRSQKPVLSIMRMAGGINATIKISAPHIDAYSVRFIEKVPHFQLKVLRRSCPVLKVYLYLSIPSIPWGAHIYARDVMAPRDVLDGNTQAAPVSRLLFGAFTGVTR